MTKELLEFAVLAVCQGIHRINHDRLYASAEAAPEYVVHGGDDVGEALSRSCSGGEDVIVSGSSCLDGLSGGGVNGGIPEPRAALCPF